MYNLKFGREVSAWISNPISWLAYLSFGHAIGDRTCRSAMVWIRKADNRESSSSVYSNIRRDVRSERKSDIDVIRLH